MPNLLSRAKTYVLGQGSGGSITPYAPLSSSDFVSGSALYGPLEGDLGFPYATRWPGWPSEWGQPLMSPYGANTASIVGARLSTVWSCVNSISMPLSTMPLVVLSGGQPIVQPRWTVNPESMLYDSFPEFMKSTVNSMLLRGESFLVATARDPLTDYPVRFVCLNPDLVQLEATRDGLTRYWLGEVGKGVEIPRQDLLHLRYQTFPGHAHGVGPLQQAAANVLSAERMQSWVSELAAAGGIPTAILQSSGSLTPEQARAISNGWAAASTDRGPHPAILPSNITYTPMNMRPEEVGLLGLREFDEKRIAATFGVPAWMLGLPTGDSMTYSTVSGQLDYFWRTCLRPIADSIGAALSEWLLPDGVRVAFDSSDYLRPAPSEEATAHKTLIEAGILTVDEARALRNLPPLGEAI